VSLFTGSREKTRYICALYYIDGMTHAQVAEEVGMSVSGVRAQLRRLRDSLREIARDTEGDDE